MAAKDRKLIERLCREQIATFVARTQPDWAAHLPTHRARITAKVMENCENGRVQKVLGKAKGAVCSHADHVRYIQQFLKFYTQHWERLLRMENDDQETWMALQGLLRKRAAGYLRNKNIVNLSADDVAQEACERIMRKGYPCDVSFDAWANLVTFNVIRRSGRSKEPLDGKVGAVASLDEPAFAGDSEPTARTRYEAVEDRAARNAFDRSDDHELLLSAIARLTNPLERAVIDLGHLQGMTDQEIMRELNVTLNQVQVARHRALKRLKSILSR